MVQTGNHQRVKAMNRWAVVSVLADRTPCSRGEIAALTGLSPTTVVAATEALLAEDLIRATGFGQSRGGRRPLLFELNPHGRYVIAADLGGTKLVTAVVGLDGRIFHSERFPVDASGAEPVLNGLLSGLEQAWEWVADPDRVMGIGIATPGLIAHDRGEVLFASNLRWKNVKLRELVSARFAVPVYVENDTNAAALGELARGVGTSFRTLVYVAVGTGIGSGIVLDGQLFRGSWGVAGEMGHITVDPDGPLCSCGNRGCLEAIASGPAIVRMAQAISGSDGGEGRSTGGELAELAHHGDPAAREAFRHAGAALGTVLGGVVNLLSPEAIIIGGGVAQAGEVFLEPLRQEVARRSLLIPGRKVQVLPSRLGTAAGLIGLWTLAFQAKFSD